MHRDAQNLAQIPSGTFQIIMNCPLATLVATAALLTLVAFQTPLLAEEDCPSAEACLSKSLENNWARYYSLIEQTWADKRKVTEQLRKAEVLNKADLVVRIKTEQAKIEERWRFAEAMARALTAPHFKDVLVSQHAEAGKVHAAARQRVQKETDLYRRLEKSTLGPERKSVIGDITGYEHEAKKLEETFYRDGLMVSLSWVKARSALFAEQYGHLANMLAQGEAGKHSIIITRASYVAALNALIISGHTGAEAVHAGHGVEEEIKNNHNFFALLEANKGASHAMLATAELIAEAPDNPLKQKLIGEAFGPIAARAGLYLNVLALGLDTGLTVATVERLKQAEARQLRVETDDAHWRARVDTAARAARDAAVREERAAQQIEQQRRVEALFKKIQEDK